MARLSIPKSYKPEIDRCPLCGGKLKYRYAVSNKVIQFSHGEKRRIKNLGYSCTNKDCPHPELIYTSQTASKLCFKGHTFSAKIIAEIMYYKTIHKSRDEIVNIFADDNVEISDRNVDIIYNKLQKWLTMDYKENIKFHYEYMKKEYGKIMLSIDSIALPDKYRFITIRSFFSQALIGVHLFRCETDDDFNILDDYLNKDLDIDLIVTIRNIGQTFPQIKKRVNDKCKFISFIKF